jgi:hypothetical protein
MDYAIEKMIGFKSLKIKIINCHNRWLAFSELVKLAAKGIACMAKWDNGSSPNRTLYVLNRGSITPELFFSDEVNAFEERLHDMTIELSVGDFDVARLSEGYSIHVDPNELAQAQNSAWNEGIFIEDGEWRTLKKLLRRFL